MNKSWIINKSHLTEKCPEKWLEITEMFKCPLPIVGFCHFCIFSHPPVFLPFFGTLLLHLQVKGPGLKIRGRVYKICWNWFFCPAKLVKNSETLLLFVSACQCLRRCNTSLAWFQCEGRDKLLYPLQPQSKARDQGSQSVKSKKHSMVDS